MIYAHDACAEERGLAVDYSAPPCSAICEICWLPGGALVLVPHVSRFATLDAEIVVRDGAGRERTIFPLPDEKP